MENYKIYGPLNKMMQDKIVEDILYLIKNYAKYKKIKNIMYVQTIIEFYPNSFYFVFKNNTMQLIDLIKFIEENNIDIDILSSKKYIFSNQYFVKKILLKSLSYFSGLKINENLERKVLDRLYDPCNNGNISFTLLKYEDIKRMKVNLNNNEREIKNIIIDNYICVMKKCIKKLHIKYYDVNYLDICLDEGNLGPNYIVLKNGERIIIDFYELINSDENPDEMNMLMENESIWDDFDVIEMENEIKEKSRKYFSKYSK